MKNIPLTRGFEMTVSDEDYNKINSYKWCVKPDKNTYYAIRRPNKKNPHRLAHRMIMGLEKGDPYEVDHIDGNGLNNDRSNLRLVLSKWNQFNGIARNRNNLPKGVGYRKGRFYAHIMINDGVNRKCLWLGTYDTIEKATEVYNKKEIELRKEYAACTSRINRTVHPNL